MQGAAKKTGKTFLDRDSIRRYFLFEHDNVVNRRYSMFRDFSTLRCRTYSGRVIKTNGASMAQVETLLIGRRMYRIDFCKNIKKGDFVVVHRDFVAEKIGEAMFRRLWKIKENYFKSNKSNNDSMKNETKGTILAIAAAVISGFSIPLNKLFVVSIDPVVFTSIRSLLIGIISYLSHNPSQATSASQSERKIPSPHRHNWRGFCISCSSSTGSG